jgi:HAE1 family hydrophobic/amphiphilic exporter-1
VDKNNTKQLLTALEKNGILLFKTKYQDLDYSLEGEIKNAGTTQQSMMSTFIVGLLGIFILLSFQFKSYIEPLIFSRIR